MTTPVKWKEIAGTIFYTLGAIGILDMMMFSISDGRFKIIQTVLGLFFGGTP